MRRTTTRSSAILLIIAIILSFGHTRSTCYRVAQSDPVLSDSGLNDASSMVVANRYVNAQNGTDQGSCTNITNPCKTLEYTTLLCSPNDVISIEGSFAPTKTINVTSGIPLSFVANTTLTSVDCAPYQLTSAFNLADSTLLFGFTIKNCGVGVSSTSMAPPISAIAAIIINLGNTNQRVANLTSMVIQSSLRAIISYSSRVYIIESTLIFNGGSYSQQTFTPTAGVNGAGIYATGSSIIASQSLFADNVARALVGGGGEPTVGGLGGAIYSYDTQLYFTDVAFTSNQAINGSGGALYLDQTELQMFNTYVNMNSALDGSGGSVYASGSTIWSINATFDHNYVAQTTYAPSLSSVNGGSVYASDCTVQLNNTALNSNSINGLTAYGGGFALFECSTMLWGIDAHNNTVVSKSGGGGGLIYANFGTTIVWNSTIESNDAIGSATGGGFMLETSTLVIYNSSIGSNHCGGGSLASQTSLYCGSAAYLTHSTFVATGVEFFNNTQNDIYCIQSSAELYDIEKDFAPTIDCESQCDASLDQTIVCSQ